MGRKNRQGRCPCFFILRLHALLIGIAWLGLPAVTAAEGVWSEIAPPTPNVLHSIEYINRVEAWGVGDDGTVVRYQDGFWRNSPSGSDEDLLDITMVGDEEAWAVGVNGTILHYSNRMWTPVPESKTLTLLPLHAVTFVNQDNGWAVGGRAAPAAGIVLHYNGSTWVSATMTQDPLYDLVAVASDDVWFCGGDRRLMYFDGSEFSLKPSPIADEIGRAHV